MTAGLPVSSIVAVSVEPFVGEQLSLCKWNGARPTAPPPRLEEVLA